MTQKIPRKYLPASLSKKDYARERRAILKSRKLYPKGKYIDRPHLDSFVSKKSSHVYRATNLYGVETMKPSPILAKATGCKEWALRKIVNKGEGAYYSSGSRPNQTAKSWGYARLGSALTGGPSSKIDYDILRRGCTRKSRPIQLANKLQKM